MAVNMNAINLEISANSSSAVAGIDKLAEALEKLKTAASNASKPLRSASSAIGELSKSVPSMASSADKASRAAGGLSSSFKSTASSSAQAANGMRGASAAAKGAGVAMTKASAPAKAAGGAMLGYAGSVQQAAARIGSFIAKSVLTLAALRTVVSGIREAVNASNEYVEDLNLFRVAMDATGATVKGYGNDVADSLGKVKDSFTSASEAAQTYAETASQALGLDPADWMRTQGVFASIISGFGVAGDKAAMMSQQLTQLGYDLSSYANISTQDAFTKLQSGISGELEPLRRLGFDLSAARLQQEAYNLGITRSVSAMDQAEKAQLRYYAILTQVTWAQGDMARTIASPANQLRILQAQVHQASRAIGDVFIPVLQRVLPPLIAFFRGVKLLADAFARLFGFKMPVFATAGFNKATKAAAASTGDLGNNVGRATKRLNKATKAAKKWKNQLLGFDEINNLTRPTKTTPRVGSGSGGSGSGVGAVGGDFDVPLPKYDFLQGVQGYIDKHPIVKFFKLLAKHAKLTLGILTGFGTSLLAGAFGKLFLHFSGKRLAGFTLFLSGITVALRAFKRMWTKGMDWDSMAAMAIGFVAAVVGAFMLFGKPGGAVALAVGGILDIQLAFKDMKKNGPTKKNVVGLVAGITALAVAFKLLGLSNPVTLILTGIAVAFLYLTTNWGKVKKFFSRTWKKMKTFGKKFVEGFKKGLMSYPPVKTVTKIFKKVIKAVKKVFGIHSPSKVMKNIGVNVVKGFFNGIKSKIDSIVDMFKKLPGKIEEALDGLGDKISELVGGAKDAAVDVAVNLKKGWDTVQDWFDGLGEKALEIVANLTKGWKKLQDWFGDEWVDIKANLAKGWKKLQDWFEGLGEKAVSIKADLAKGWTKLQDWFDGLKETLSLKVVGFVKGWSDTLADWFGNLKGDGDMVKIRVGGFVKAWKKNANKWFQGLKKGNTANLHLSKLVKSWGSANKWFQGLKHGNKASLKISGFVKAWKGSVSSWFKKVIGAITVPIKLGSIIGGGIKAWVNKHFRAAGGVFRNGGWHPVATAATGGAFNQGQMFIAREAGPELVGTIGGHTAVMNNNQIVGSVSDGVYRAVLRAMTQTSNSGGDVILTIDGRELGRAAIRGINSANRQMGRTQIVY